MTAWNEIQDHLENVNKKVDSWDVRHYGGGTDDYTQSAKEARSQIKKIIFDLEAKADERDHLRKMLTEARAEVTNLELDLERLTKRWDASLDERVAEIEKGIREEMEVQE